MRSIRRMGMLLLIVLALVLSVLGSVGTRAQDITTLLSKFLVELAAGTLGVIQPITTVQLSATLFAALPATPTNGMMLYCSDCVLANPCAGAGTGAIAQRLNGAWVCNGGGSAGGAGAAKVQTGTGSPEGVVTGAIGDLFLRTNGVDGTSAYNKISGAGNTGWVPLTTAASFNTFTFKTLNAESNGNDITIPFTIWIPAAWCQNTTPTTLWNLPATDPAVAACLTGTNTIFGTLDYADGGNALSAQWPLVFFSSQVSTVDIDIKWITSATSGNVVWQVATGCMGNGFTVDPAFNTASTVTDAADGTANQFNTAIITTLTINNCSAGGLGVLKVLRDPANGADTIGATARLLGITVTYRRLT